MFDCATAELQDNLVDVEVLAAGQLFGTCFFFLAKEDADRPQVRIARYGAELDADRITVFFHQSRVSLGRHTLPVLSNVKLRKLLSMDINRR